MMKQWGVWLLAALFAFGSLGLGLRAEAFSGGEPPTAAQVLESAELIVIASGGEELGTVDLPGGPIYTLYRLHVESYIRPAAPGPDTLVVTAIGGRGLYRAMDGPSISETRSLYFLKRNGDSYALAVGRMTPRIPLEGDDFPVGIWADHQAAFRPLLGQPRYQPYPMPAVRLNGRQIGTAWLDAGRSYLPAEQLAAALGATVATEPDGVLAFRRGEATVRDAPGPRADDAPLRAVADGLGVEIWWDAAGWAVELSLPAGLPAEPVYLSQAQAVDALAGMVNAVIAEGKGGGSFADYYHVPQARLNPDWIDPRTGGLRPVWELGVAPRGVPEAGVRSLVDAVTGEAVLMVWK